MEIPIHKDKNVVIIIVLIFIFTSLNFKKIITILLIFEKNLLHLQYHKHIFAVIKINGDPGLKKINLIKGIETSISLWRKRNLKLDSFSY